MADAVTVHGGDRLAATLRDAGADLSELTAEHAAAAARLVTAAQGLVPVRTGRLRASIFGTSTADTATVTAGAPYAAYVHARTPFLSAALDQSQAAVLGIYAAGVDDALSTVKGK